MERISNWDKLKRPPTSALKEIKGGRLSGYSDISPQWRYQVMDEVFGQCGVGWKFEIVRLWIEQGTEGQVFTFAHIHVFTKNGDTWSDPIPGVGGSFLIEKESKGLFNSDEGFKMAITDAIGTALKMIGVAADIYAGLFNTRTGKYEEKVDTSQSQKAQMPTTEEIEGMRARLKALDTTSISKVTAWLGNKKIAKIDNATKAQLDELDAFIKPLEAIQKAKTEENTTND